MMRSRRASSSWPRRSTSASDRCAAALGRLTGPPVAARTGFLGRVVVAVPATAPTASATPVGIVVGRFVVAVMGCFPFLDVQVDGSGGCVDAGLDQLALVAVHLAGAQVAHLAGDERDEAAAADAHAAPAGHHHTALLAGFEEGDVAAHLRLLVRLLERQQATLAAGPLQQDGRETLDGQVLVGLVVAVAQPQLGRRVEELRGSAGVCCPLAPVGTERLEVGCVGEVQATTVLL